MSENKGRKLKGSVLFTTLTVMFVMIILILTTIALAGAASRKAYSNWYDNQTNYTAQSLVDDVVASLANGENAELGNAIIDSIEQKVGNSVTVDVTEGTSSTIPGYGKVEKITFTNVGNNSADGGNESFYLKENSVTKRDKMIVKITAEVSMNGGKEKSTYSKYVIGSSEQVVNPSPSGPGGLNALSNFKSGNENDSIWTYGKTYAGILDPLNKFDATNDQRLGGDIYLNLNGNTYTFNAQSKRSYIFGRNDPYNNNYSGLRVDGNLEFGSKGYLTVVSMYGAEYTAAPTDATPKNADFRDASIPYNDSFNNIPYLYVQNEIKYDSSNDAIHVFGGALNIFCNNMSITGSRGIEGLTGKFNLICLGNVLGGSKDNVIEIGNASKLVGWVAKTINPANSTEENSSTVDTGNIYCNGNLTVKSAQPGKTLVVPGNLYVSGTLTCNAPIEVGGLVYYGNIAGSSAVDKAPAADTELGDLTKKYNDAITIKKSINGSTSNDLEMFQTLENVKNNFNPKKDAVGTHVDGERDSSKQGVTDDTATDEYRFNGYAYRSKDSFDGAYVVLKGNSFIFDKATMGCFMNGTVVFIQPAEKKTINIDFTKDFTGLGSDCKIIIDDTYGAEIYLNGKGNRTSFTLNNRSRIMSLAYCKLLDSTTYNELLKISKENASVDAIDDTGVYKDLTVGADNYYHLQTYYDNPHPLIPKIKIYAAPGDNLKFVIDNGSMITADLIMPDAILDAKGSGYQKNIRYTSMAANGEAKDNYDIYDPNADIKVIGSIALTQVNVDNIMAYYYVDESKKKGQGPGDKNKGYAWSDVDGYSNY